MKYYSTNPWYERISNPNKNNQSNNNCYKEIDEEGNEVMNKAAQIFEISDIEGSTINGNITNNQVQVIVNLVFDNIILFGGIPLLGDVGNSVPAIASEDGKFKLDIKEGSLIINGKELKLEKQVLEDGKKVLVFKTESQELETE